jgi:hypothetical protein
MSNLSPAEGTPITFETHGLFNSDPLLDGVVESVVFDSLLVRDERGLLWLVAEHEVVEVHEVH